MSGFSELTPNTEELSMVPGQRWRPRPLAASMAHLGIDLLPTIGAVVSAFVASVVFRELGWRSHIGVWWAIVGTLTILPFVGLARWSPSIRPFAELLCSSAIFPAAAPGRWTVARMGWNRSARADNQHALTVVAPQFGQVDTTSVGVARQQMIRVLGLGASYQSFDRRGHMRSAVAWLVADHLAHEMGYSNRSRAGIAWSLRARQLAAAFDRAGLVVLPLSQWFGMASAWLGFSWHEPTMPVRVGSDSLTIASATTPTRVADIALAFADSYVDMRRGDGTRRRRRAWRDIEALSVISLDRELVALLRLSAGVELWTAIDRVFRRNASWRRFAVLGAGAVVTCGLVWALAQPPAIASVPSPWPIFG